MTKAEARALFGDRVADLAAALGITPQAIYQWPDDLDQATADRVTGAALRLGRLPTQRSAEATAIRERDGK